MPDPSPQLEQRLIDLEIHIAHLEHTLSQLDQVLISQSRQLRELQQRLEQWEQHLQGNTAPDSPPANEKPPHY